MGVRRVLPVAIQNAGSGFASHSYAAFRFGCASSRTQPCAPGSQPVRSLAYERLAVPISICRARTPYAAFRAHLPILVRAPMCPDVADETECFSLARFPRALSHLDYVAWTKKEVGNMVEWKLTIKDPCSSLWVRSSSKEDVVIDAKSEILARLGAALKYGVAVCKQRPGQDLPTSPWLDSEVVSCARLLR